MKQLLTRAVIGKSWKKKIEMFCDYFSWNLKPIGKEKFMMGIKKLEKIVYSTGIIIGEERISEMIRISLGRKKPEKLFNDLIIKLNVFNEIRKRQYYKGEKILDADDAIKGNLLFAMVSRKEPV
jgi:hypothetical protein